MKIVKPYGRTTVERPGPDRRRMLSPRGSPHARLDIADFAEAHDELVLAQWISTLDKIARKPAAGAAPTAEQRAFRDRLGAACWLRMLASERLPGAVDPLRRDKLERIWRAKVAPYGPTDARPRLGAPSPSTKGAWYARFAGADAVATDVDATLLADRIDRHLHAQALRISPDSSPRRRGLIADRALSIRENVPSTTRRLGVGAAPWGEEDRSAYLRAGDVAVAIFQAALKREAGDDGTGRRRVGPDVAARLLYVQYGRLFADTAGRPLSVAAATACQPGLFALHTAIRETYRRLLKGHRKDLRAHGSERRAISTLLPKSFNDLLELTAAHLRNQDLAGLVRLGKVVHYEAGMIGADSPLEAVRNWPADVTTSLYWNSDGLAEIKHSEASVRIWRRALSLAARALTDWADPRGVIGGDILLAQPMARALGPDFDPTVNARKLDLLFGHRAALFKTQTASDVPTVLALALKSVAQLRHAALHFKGVGTFVDALTAAGTAGQPVALAAALRLWNLDAADRADRIVATARGLFIDRYFAPAEGRVLFAAIAQAPTDGPALPRFLRVLKRAADAWSSVEGGPGLPAPHTGSQRHDLAVRCREGSLRLLYDRPFRAWVGSRSASTLNAYIDAAVTRATAAARRLNARSDEERADLIVARAAGLPRLQLGEGPDVFFARLAAETATEMRVQRGYDSDPSRARAQAGYIENLKLDLVALAFADYLAAAGVSSILALAPGTQPTALPLFDLAEAVPPTVRQPALPEDWQAVLYFVLHLIPVDDAARLLHQVRKSEAIGIGPGSSMHAPLRRRLIEVLELYLDMHDAKFEGTHALTGVGSFRSLFQVEADFERVFPRHVTSLDDDRVVAKRGLREVMRFGHRPILAAIYARHPVRPDEVRDVLAGDVLTRDGLSAAAGLQAERERLHALWVRQGRGFPPESKARYHATLQAITRLRHAAGRVTLSDHIRLHRLLMAVWARLVDYAGIWERDLYFTTLGLIHSAGLTPAEALNAKGLRLLANGQIIQALREGDPVPALLEGLEPHFTGVWKPGSRAAKIRNRLAHFNMLRGAEPVDLTYWVNLTRELLRHDRKLKNAVTQSIKELLARENLELGWRTDPRSSHEMGPATLQTLQVIHLRDRELREDMHGFAYVQMVAALFGQCDAQRPPPVQRPPSVLRPLSPRRASN